MCGIFAVSTTDKNFSAGESVLEGLKKLEYRGYDSWGIAVKTGEEILVKKGVGKISQVKNDFQEGPEAIGHTRWATHGGVTEANAHPHTYGKVTLVHNGIFENYLQVKKQFPADSFASQTDSEVIAALVDRNLSEGMEPKEAIAKTASHMAGRFGIVVMIEGVEGIFAVRRGSPLILGRGKTETYIASDIPAFLNFTKTVNYLDDNEMVFIHKGTVCFYDLKTLEKKEKRNIEVKWSPEQAEKGDYEHFMLKEIFDQKDTIARAINHEDHDIFRAISLLQSTNGCYFTGCGTAHKVIMAAEYFFADIAGRKINVVAASEMESSQRFIHSNTTVVAVSQSGETADILEVLEQAKAKGAKILAITNVESSSIARLADVHLPINAGIEKAVASTKATTSQMALLLLLAYAEKQDINKGREILRNTSASINDMLNPRYEDHIRSIAKTIVKHDNLFIIGRKSMYPMALEAAIKIQEVSYIHAQGFAAGEIKHGPIALIEKGTPCLVIGDDLETLSNATELKSRGAMIIGVSRENSEIFDHWIKVPDCSSAQPIASIIPVQILAYHLATLRGLDPDMPRNLAKSVTVK